MASLRHRNCRFWFAGQAASLVGTWMRPTAQGAVMHHHYHHEIDRTMPNVFKLMALNLTCASSLPRAGLFRRLEVGLLIQGRNEFFALVELLRLLITP